MISFQYIAEKNTGISIKLSSILCDLPLDTRKTLTKPDLDSIFRYFLFRPSQGNIQLLSKGEILNNKYTKYYLPSFLILDHKNDSSLGKNKSKIYNLINYINDNCDKNNYYAYFAPSVMANYDPYVLISINEGMVSENINEFYMSFNNEPILYNIKVYSAFYFY